MLRELTSIELEYVSGGALPGQAIASEENVNQMATTQTHIIREDDDLNTLTGTLNGNLVVFVDADDNGLYEQVWRMDDEGNWTHSLDGTEWHRHNNIYDYSDLWISQNNIGGG